MPTETTRQRLARLASRPPAGRPPLRPQTPDARLVDLVCSLRGMTRTELAAELGCSPAALSHARQPRGLSRANRDALQRMVDDSQKEVDSGAAGA